MSDNKYDNEYENEYENDNEYESDDEYESVNEYENDNDYEKDNDYENDNEYDYDDDEESDVEYEDETEDEAVADNIAQKKSKVTLTKSSKASKGSKVARSKKSSLPQIKLDTKKLKKYFNKQTFLGITLVGLLVIVVVYVLVYLKYMEKTESLEASNQVLKNEIRELEEYYNNMEMYKEEIEIMRAAVGDIMSEYPADAREEDIIMMAVQMQENNAISYASINMEESEGVYTVPQNLVAPAQIEGLENDIVFAQKHATYVNETDYHNLKGCIEDIFASPHRIAIENIVYAKDEEDGTLEGNISLYLYSAQGTDKVYEAPDISKYISGTDDLFKTGKVVKKSSNKSSNADKETSDSGENAGEEASDEKTSDEKALDGESSADEGVSDDEQSEDKKDTE